MSVLALQKIDYPISKGSFWTNRQRQGHSLNEISYRACFKPQLPQYFIDRYSKAGDIVLDPFMGRGTTALQSALSGRIAYGSDINPLSVMLARPRLSPPFVQHFIERFNSIPNDSKVSSEDKELLAFYHPNVLRHLVSLKNWFLAREKDASLTIEDEWIRMVIMNRLSGHSKGFLSVKTMPPNQTVSIARQKKINEKYNRTPEEKNILDIIVRKSKSLLRSPQLPVKHLREKHKLHCCGAAALDYIKDSEIDLLITSPPFMNVVNYSQDNWLRCWFAGVDTSVIAFDDYHSSVESWTKFVRNVFGEFARVVKKSGVVAFEVGEVKNGSIKLEENVVDAIRGLPFCVEEILVNSQTFTKTSNCWGVKNNEKGTNTNRIIVARRV